MVYQDIHGNWIYTVANADYKEIDDNFKHLRLPLLFAIVFIIYSFSTL